MLLLNRFPVPIVIIVSLLSFLNALLPRLHETKGNWTARSFKHLFESVIYCILLLGFQLPWQFSQFALSTQIASLLIACCLTVASNQFHRSDHRLLVRGVRSVVSIHLIALVLSYLLQFGNALLLTSVYFPGLIGAWLGLTVLLRYLTPSETSELLNPYPYPLELKVFQNFILHYPKPSVTLNIATVPVLDWKGGLINCYTTLQTCAEMNSNDVHYWAISKSSYYV